LDGASAGASRRAAGGVERAGPLAELSERGAPPLAAQLTLVSLLLAPIGAFGVRAAVLALAAAALLAPSLAARASLWLGLAALAALRVALDWPLSDNHAYLLAYWCLALGLALASPAPAPTLARAARLLVAAVFALATLQKALAPDYLDGTFFRYALAVDGRFEDLGRLLGRDGEALVRTRAFLEAAPWAAPAPDAAFVETPALRAAAAVFTWLTFLGEAAVALAFLAPVPARLRHATLLGFCAVTYAVAPVAGFGWLLLALGAAQTEPPEARTRRLYVGAFALLLFYREVPWLAWAAWAAQGG